MRATLSVSGLLLLAACATSGPRFDRSANLDKAGRDPWEYSNRQMYDVNRKVDKATLKPIAQAYQAVMPGPVRRGVQGFFGTVSEPSNAINAALQGKPKRMFRAIDRLFINTVFGLTVMDPATKWGLERQPNDFGQTLAVWGVHSGPYMVMPVLGPSTPRDGLGFIVDFILDPMNFVDGEILNSTAQTAKLGTRVVNFRYELLDQEKLLTGVADEYATVRSAWLQTRRDRLYDGKPPAAAESEDEAVEPYPENLPPPNSAAPAGPDR
jgi:phospholipid-binding lipoprotein MlaA